MSFVSRYLEPALVERLNHLQLSARRVVEGSTTGLHKSPLKGASVEFRQHRSYVPGDELRRLDWRVLGRTDRHYVKEYDEETNLRCVLMLDRSGSMAYGADGHGKFDYAARLTAALAYLMLANTESVGLAIFGAKLEQWIKPHSGTGQLSRMIDAIERVSPGGGSDPGLAMHQVAERLGHRALVIVVSDFFSPVPIIRKGLAHFGHDRHEVILMRVLDGDEIAFPFRTWARFRGMEGESPELCEPALMRDIYLSNFERHARELAEGCRSLGGELMQFVTDRPLIDSLTRFLHQRQR